MAQKIEQAELQAYMEQHQEEMVGFLSEILRIPSVTGSELEVSKAFTKRMEALNLPVQVVGTAADRPNLIATWQGTGEGPSFLFNGHMDVFPPAVGEPPEVSWSGKIEDGYFH